MTERTITISSGSIISIENRGGETIVLLDHPEAPADMRPTEAGRVVEGCFQPAPFAPWALRPEGLRAIADLIEAASNA